MRTKSNSLSPYHEKQSLTLRDKIYLNLFESDEEAALVLTEAEMKIKRRWMAIYSKLLDEPFTTNRELVTFITMGGEGAFDKVEKSQAYRDIEVIQSLLGNIQNATKTWVRHIVYESCLEAIQMAKLNKDVKGLAMAADKLGKYFKLDQDDIDPLEWDRIIPPSFEPTDDITVLGIVKINNLEERRRKLRQMFNPDVQVQDAEIIE